MIYPTLEQAGELAKENVVVPLSLELMADRKTAIEILRNIRRQSEHFFILESVTSSDNWSRYTFLGYAPSMVITGRDGSVTVKDGEKVRTIAASEAENPIEYLRETLRQYKSPRVDGLPPFTGGFVGYFSYDFVKYADPAPVLKAKNPHSMDDFGLLLIDKVIAIDYFKQKIYLIANVKTENLQENYIRAVADLREMKRLILGSTQDTPEKSHCGEFTPMFTKEDYFAGVETLKRHIREGDIFQAVLSNCFQAPFSGTLLEPYRFLRMINPSPYMVYLHMEDMEIAGASPETLVTLRDGRLTSFPLAGTRPKCSNEEENQRRAEELLADAKELSEHDMLVDLARNDLGKISRFGSVRVEEIHSIKQYSHVMHISSTVTGDIAPGKDALDAVLATLPAGTLSGAPKKRACELLDQIEDYKRGPYGGALGYIDFTGNADLCIGIRMAVLKDKTVYVRVGSGIVADSVPEKEYNETLQKAEAVMQALKSDMEE